MAEYSFRQSSHIGLLNLSGALTKDCFETLRQGFLVSFEHSDYVIVDLRHVTGLDAECLSLFCAANRILTGRNKRLFLVSPDPKVSGVIEDARRSEYSFRCDEKCRDGCLWNR